MVNLVWSLTGNHFIVFISSCGTDLTISTTNFQACVSWCGNTQAHFPHFRGNTHMCDMKRALFSLGHMLVGGVLVNDTWQEKQSVVLWTGFISGDKGTWTFFHTVISVHWPLYYGNKLMMTFANTKLKECCSTYTDEMWASNDCISVQWVVVPHY